MSSALDKQQALEQIEADILKANICPDLAKTATNLVMGGGNPDADIVFIGEAPGKHEDLQGLPFVGAAGKFLNEMLSTIELERSDVYITNIVKYRPPNNRDPLPDEKQAFWPYLLQQLKVIEPKVVITLGRHSMEYFMPKQRISAVHGQPKRITIRWSAGDQGVSAMQGGDDAQTESYPVYGEGVQQPVTQQRATSDGQNGGSATVPTVTTLVILPLFHPAAALYNGGLRQTLLDDFANIPAMLAAMNEEHK